MISRIELLSRLPQHSVGAEIGVWKGEFSLQILKMLKPKQLHLIDPWIFLDEYPTRWYGGAEAADQFGMDEIFDGVQKLFTDQDEVVLHRGTSAGVLEKFTNGYFDWVYIDGDHSYSYVLTDLWLSLGKVRSGGIICGDDYLWGEDLPVKRAVQDFVSATDLDDRLEIIGSQYLIQLEEKYE